MPGDGGIKIKAFALRQLGNDANIAAVKGGAALAHQQLAVCALKDRQQPHRAGRDMKGGVHTKRFVPVHCQPVAIHSPDPIVEKLHAPVARSD